MKKLFQKQLSLWLMIATTMSLSAATYTVTTTADAGAGSLRQAITDANASAGPHTINFSITGTGPFTISPATALPTIVQNVTVNGLSQSGSSCTGSLMITLNFSTFTATSTGLRFGAAATGSTVSGLNIVGSRDGITLDANCHNMTINCCFIGTNADASAIASNLITRYGVFSTSNNNLTITNSVISGCTTNGIYMLHGDKFTITGCKIGTNAAGTARIQNGIGITRTTSGTPPVTSVGSTINNCVVSGSNTVGIQIQGYNGLTISNCKVGTNLAGTDSIPNRTTGISLQDYYASATSFIPSKKANIFNNVISGNGTTGLDLLGDDSVTINNNKIGTNTAGTAAIFGSMSGTFAQGQQYGVNFGYSATGPRESSNVWVTNNVISGNIRYTTAGAATTAYGVNMNTVSDPVFKKNMIGMNAAGTDSIPNFYGVNVVTYSPIIIDSNVISANRSTGFTLTHGTSLTLTNNQIGTDKAGNVAMPNRGIGFTRTTTTATPTVLRNSIINNNIVSSNTSHGIAILGYEGMTVTNNKIGTNASGTVAMGNLNAGITLQDYYGSATVQLPSKNCVVENNVISANGTFGIYFLGDDSVVVNNNKIGTNATGTSGLLNITNTGGFLTGQHGLYFDFSTTGSRRSTNIKVTNNVISGNIKYTNTGTLTAAYGVYMSRVDTAIIAGNKLGTNAAGTDTIANQQGIFIISSATDSTSSNITIGGLTASERNIISGNKGTAISLSGGRTFNNKVIGNYIGLNAAGTDTIANTGYGIFFYSGANNNTIGGNTASARNIISGNRLSGIWVTSANNNKISGNYIGTSTSTSTSLPNLQYGVGFSAAANNMLGGTTAAEANVIANNLFDGVLVTGSAGSVSSGNSILLNSIYNSGRLGIDLTNPQSPNVIDPNDADTAGGNMLMNFPLIKSVRYSGGNYLSNVDLDLQAGNYRIDLYRNTVADESGYGEGRTHVGFATISHAGAGVQNYNLTIAGSAPGNPEYFTMTTTECTNAGCTTFGSTSEFAANYTMRSMEHTANTTDDDGDGLVDCNDPDATIASSRLTASTPTATGTANQVRYTNVGKNVLGYPVDIIATITQTSTSDVYTLASSGTNFGLNINANVSGANTMLSAKVNYRVVETGTNNTSVIKGASLIFDDLDSNATGVESIIVDNTLGRSYTTTVPSNISVSSDGGQTTFLGTANQSAGQANGAVAINLGTDISSFDIQYNFLKKIAGATTDTFRAIGNNAFTGLPTCNVPLIVNDDYATTNASTAVAISVMNNDYDYENDFNFATLSLIGGASNGTLSLNTITKQVTYTPNAGFSGVDKFRYRICENAPSSRCDTAFVYVKVNSATEICNNGIDDDGDGKIDGFDTDCACSNNNYSSNCVATCAISVSSDTTLPVAQSWTSALYRTRYPVITAGDIDNDGKVEIVFPTVDSISQDTQYIMILRHDGTVKNRIYYPDSLTLNVTGTVSFADVNSDGTAELFVMSQKLRKILSYTPTGTLLWQSNTQLPVEYFTNSRYSSGGMINLADFNHDGVPEVYVGSHIFNAQTGKLLAYGNAGSGNNRNMWDWSNRMTIAADVLPEYYGMELVAGRTVYITSLTNTNDTTGNTMTPINAPSGYKDGFSAMADVDMDGNLDVVVNNSEGIYVWNPRYMTIIAKYDGTMDGITSNGSFPFIGDMDGDCNPEIGVTYPFRLLTFKYNGTQTLQKLFDQTTTDGSGATGITMFDFNQDGVSELVYRDEDNLRIINGATGSTISSFGCPSGTALEYPVVVDIDNDGNAEILAVCADPNKASTYCKIVCYESAGRSWAPARKVWNQPAYHNTNINDNLTIPKFEQSTLMAFSCPTECAKPYNSFLEQATFRTQGGCRQFPTFDAKISSVSYTCLTDSTVQVQYTLSNLGSIDIPADLVMSFYKSNPKFNTDTAYETKDTSGTTIAPGGSIVKGKIIKFPITRYPLSLYVVANDNGRDTPPIVFPVTNYSECNVDNNIDSVVYDFQLKNDTIIKTCINSMSYKVSFEMVGDGPFTASGTGAPGTWAGKVWTSGSIASGTNLNVTMIGTAFCTFKDTLIITDTPPNCACPTIVAPTSGGNKVICKGSTIPKLTATAPAGKVVDWYSDSTGGTLLLAHKDSFLPSVVNAGVYKYYAESNDTGFLCKSASRTMVSLTIDSLPVVNAGKDTSLCPTSSGTISYSLAASNSIGSGTWTQIDANPGVSLTGSTNPSQSVTLSSGFTYKFQWAVTNGTCIVRDTVNITVNTLPTANAGSDKTRVNCAGDSVQIGTASASGFSYAWSPKTGLNDSTLAMPWAKPTATTTYTLTITNTTTGCKASDDVLVSVTPSTLYASAGTDKAVCLNTTGVTIGASPTATGGTPGYLYTWTPSTSLSSASAANPTIVTTSAFASRNYALMVTDAKGCIYRDTVAVVVNALPTANAGLDTNMCAGGSRTIGSATVAGHTYSWSPSTGLNSSTVSNPTFSITTPGSYSFNVTVTNSTTLCTATDGVLVTVNALPTANAGSDKTRVNCVGDSVQIGTASVAGHTYSWSPTTSLSSSTIAQPWAKPTANTTYIMTMTNTTTGCTNTDDVIVNVTNSTLTADAGSDKIACQGSAAQSIGGAPTASSGNPTYTYAWTPATGLSSTTIANPSASTATVGVTNYALLLTDAKGCIARDTVNVTINALPTANAGRDTAVCAGLPAPIGSTAVAGTTYAWSPSTGLASGTASSTTFTSTTPGTYTFTVTATTTAIGCTATDIVVVTVNGLPTANAGSDKTRVNCVGDSVQIGTASVAGHTYSWSPTTNLSSSTIAQPWAKPTANTTYIMTITNTTTGCTNTDDVLVTVNNSTLFADAGADKSACRGASTFTIGGIPTAIGGTPAYNYAWTPTTNLSSATIANPSVTTSTVGITNYALLLTDAKGCIHRDTVRVEIKARPSVAITSSTLAMCSGGTRTVTSTPTGGSWSTSAGSVSGGIFTAPTVTVATSVTLSYTYTNPTTGCDSTATASIMVNPNPDLSSVVLTPTTGCVPSAGGSIAVSATALSAGQTGLWTTLSSTTGSLSYTSSASANTSVSTLMPANTYILRWTVTAGGCSSSKDLTINTSLIPEVEAGANDTICPGQSITLTAVDNSTTPASYSWKANSITSTTLSTTTSVTVAPTITTNYIFIASIGSCVTRDTLTVAVIQRPILSDDLSCLTGTEDVVTKYAVASTIRTNDNLTPVLKGGVTYSVISTKVGSASIVNDTLTYTPTLNYFGTDTVTVVAISNMCASLKDTSVVCIAVAPVNDAPVAANDTTSLLSGGTATLNLLGNDTDVDNTLTGTNISMMGSPTNGTISGPDASGNITYTPTPGFVGVDSVAYKICDNGSPVKCDTAYAYFNVGNNLLDTTLTTDGITSPVTIGTPITPAPGTSIIASISGPDENSGTATINPITGLVTFIPNDTPFVGKDTITRTICTVFGTDTICDVSYIIINNPGVDVVLRDTTPMNTPTTFAALTPIIFEGIPVAPVVDPTLTINSDGTVTYTPPVGFVGTDTATIVRCDHLGNCVTTTYIVNVPPAIKDTTIITDGVTTPIAVGPTTTPAAGSAITDTELIGPSNNSGTATIDPTTGVVTFIPNDTAFVGKDTIKRVVCVDGVCDTSLIIINNPGVDKTFADTTPMSTATTYPAITPVIFEGTPIAPVVDPTLTINADGTVTYTPPAGFVGVDTATITRCDNLGNCVTNTYITTVVPKLKDTTASTPSGTPIAIGSPLTLGPGAVVTSPTPTNGTVTVNPDGTITYTPKLGFVGIDTVKRIVCVNGICDTSLIIVTVTPPAIKIYPDIAVGFLGENISGNLSTNDDIVAGTTYGSPIASSTNPSSSVPTINADGTYTFTSTVPGIYEFTVTVCPPGMTTGCPTQTLTITVLDPKSTGIPPVVNNDNAITKPSTPVTINVLGNDVSVNPNTSLNPSSVTITKQPTNGTATVGSDGKVTYTPKPGFIGKDTIYYSVCDNSVPPLCGSAMIIVEVTEDAGKIADVQDDVNSGSGTLNGNVLSNDNFPVGSKPHVTPQTVTIPGKGTFVIDANGNYTWTPVAGFTGSVQIPIIVCDGLTPENCYSSTIHIITLLDNDINIPNYFSPNGDGKDDNFVIPASIYAKYPNLKMTIYNRWGNIVWRSTGKYNNDWHGQSLGSELPVPDGVYYYLIELNSEFRETKTGFVEVMRQ